MCCLESEADLDSSLSRFGSRALIPAWRCIANIACDVVLFALADGKVFARGDGTSDAVEDLPGVPG